MPHGDLVWCDLSALDLSVAKPFYTDLFGWSFTLSRQPDGSPYDIASASGREAAALFEMPQKFQDMGLPSFWMPYFAVEDVDAMIATAKANGGTVELGPLDWGDRSRIALVRDPLGAGFTVIEGGHHDPRFGTPEAGVGHCIAAALYVSDLALVSSFYKALFGWTLRPRSDGTITGETATGRRIVEFMQVGPELRGEYEFWSLDFAVEDLTQSELTIMREGGRILSREGTLLAQDPSGAAFFVREMTPEPDEDAGSDGGHHLAKWKTWAALAVLLVATLLGQNWIWGLFFLLWTLPALRSGETFLVEPVRRDQDPALFWVVIGTWIALGALVFIAGV